MGRVQMNRRGDPHLSGLFPARRAETPFISRLQTRKPEFRTRRDQVIAAIETILKKIGRDVHANCMKAVIHRACIAATIPEKPRQGIVTAIGQGTAQHILRRDRSVAHAA